MLKDIAVAILGLFGVLMIGPILASMDVSGSGVVLLQIALAFIYLIGVAVYFGTRLANR